MVIASMFPFSHVVVNIFKEKFVTVEPPLILSYANVSKLDKRKISENTNFRLSQRVSN